MKALDFQKWLLQYPTDIKWFGFPFPLYHDISQFIFFIDTSSAGCKSNEWMNVDGVCYLFVFSESLSFYEAETYCLKYNAHLTSLHSLPTNYKISSKFKLLSFLFCVTYGIS